MLLPPEDATLFFKLMPALQVFANQKLHIIKSLGKCQTISEGI